MRLEILPYPRVPNNLMRELISLILKLQLKCLLIKSIRERTHKAKFENTLKENETNSWPLTFSPLQEVLQYDRYIKETRKDIVVKNLIIQVLNQYMREMHE